MSKSPSQEIFKEKQYATYLSEFTDIYENISNIFIKNPSLMCTTDELCNMLGIDIDKSKYVEQSLCIWTSHLCTFFKYGRIIWSHKHDKWFWISNLHPLAREHSPKIYQPSVYYKKTKQDILPCHQ